MLALFAMGEVLTQVRNSNEASLNFYGENFIWNEPSLNFYGENFLWNEASLNFCNSYLLTRV